MASTTYNSRAKEAARKLRSAEKRQKRQQRRESKRNKTQCTVSEGSSDEFSIQR